MQEKQKKIKKSYDISALKDTEACTVTTQRNTINNHATTLLK